MGIFANVRSSIPANVGAYPQSQPPPQPSALSRAGEIADILLTGGLFHALNQRALAQGLMQQQARDYADAAGMFTPGSVTQSAPAPLPNASDPFVQGMFKGYGGAPTETFGANSAQVTPAQIPTLEQFAPVAARMASHGADPSAFMSIIKGAEPDIQTVNGVAYDRHKVAPGTRIGVNLTNVNNRLVDTQNPDNANLTVPQVDKGQVAVYDAKGNPIGVMNLPGNVEAQAEVAGATAGAQERAKAGLDLVDIPLANGSSIKLPRLQAAQLLGGQGAQGQTAPERSGFGMSQTPGDKSYSEDQAKAANAAYQQIQTAGRQAPAKIAQYQQLGKLFDGVNGNRLSPTGLEISRFAKSMGLPVDPRLGNKEAGMALANQIALTLRDPTSGGGMPGSMSNSDRQFLVNMVPNLAQTDQGRRQLIDIYVAKASRDQDVSNLARKWQQRYGRIDAPDGNGLTFEDQLQKWSEMHPMFGQH